MAFRNARWMSVAVFVVFAVSVPSAHGAAVNLGTADSYAVLGGSTVTNTGPTVVNGDLGLSPGSSVTGFPPGTVNGTMHVNDAAAAQAQSDLTAAYNDAAGRASNVTVSGDLGGRTLTTGVYTSASTIGLTGDLTLDAQGNPDATFIFQVGSTLTTASASRVVLINGAQPCNVAWQIGSSATLGTNSTFVGDILALTSITVTTGSNVTGRALARNGAITLDTNNVNRSTCAAASGGGDTPVDGGGDTPVDGGGDTPVDGGGDTPVDGGGDTPESGTPGTPTRITGPPTACVRTPFYARVTGRNIARVLFLRDGRPVRLVKARAGRTAFVLLIKPSRQGYGVHRITARVTFTAASGKSPRTLRLVYQRCGRVYAPQFAG